MEINIDEKKDNKINEDFENKQEVRELEEFYTTGKVTDMLLKVEENKQKITRDIIEYASVKKNVNPIIITNYFFKPITPIACQEPQYSAEQLGMIFDYYCHVLAEVNDKIGYFPSSLTAFCKLAGITTSTLRNFKNSSDLNMRIIVEKIYDQITDENITMSQMDFVKERSTIFKLKAQNEVVEKIQPKVNINVVEMPDMERVQQRLSKYKDFAEKKKR